ncbi:helix-turn-helix transcriptional regulator [Caldalkalibacillus salinus]|uniref:helix-turn-helix transcriptional regulator n=1 Tax=Caldalkalibacillus salinus TaxID=2803787 RepID=UPI0019251183|nr:helix-turn-helix transcriptional regulator [Caldalkalibacillus salinus]
MDQELTPQELDALRSLAKKFPRKGIRKRRFRRPKTWTIANRFLYGLMFVYDLKCADLAEAVGVSERTVNAWVFEGRIPSDENKEKVAQVLDCSVHILFNAEDIKKELRKSEESE